MTMYELIVRPNFSRSKVPHSRFSCVQQGPALEPSSPSSSSSSSTSVSSPGGDSAGEEAAAAAVPPPIGEAGGETEACLLTAQ